MCWTVFPLGRKVCLWGFFSCHNRTPCCYLFALWDDFWRRLLPISLSTAEHTGELQLWRSQSSYNYISFVTVEVLCGVYLNYFLHSIKLRRNKIYFCLANSLLSLLHLKKESTPTFKWLWISNPQVSISFIHCYFPWETQCSLNQWKHFFLNVWGIF